MKDTKPAPTIDAGTKALQELTNNQLRCEQQEIRDAHVALSQLNVPTNGAEGAGKRQSLSLAQRIAHLRTSADVIAKARAVVEAAFYATTVPNDSGQLRVKHMIVDLSTALDQLDAVRQEPPR